MANKEDLEGRDGTHTEDLSSQKESHLTRKLSIAVSVLLAISVLFLILVEIGSTHPKLTSIYFIRINLSQIVPATIPNAALLNTIAQTLGLHDYYQVGLWNFCEGNVGVGITKCSKPKTLYWFNPVEILLSELLAGATIAIPAQFVTYLRILELASQVMFGLFLSGLLLSVVVAIAVPFCRRGFPLFLASLGVILSCLVVTIASVIATAVFTILSAAATSYSQLNIGAEVGRVMLGLMWTASLLSVLAFILQSMFCCCCRGRRKRENPKKSEKS